MAKEENKTHYFAIVNEWFAFQSQNKNVKPMHATLYLYIVNKFNQLFWKDSIGLPTDFTMELLNIGSYNTFKKTINDLIEFGFIKELCKGENQFKARIIALSFFDESLDKSLSNHCQIT